MAYHQPQRSHASSSPMSSASSMDEVFTSDHFFAPEYPSSDIKTWRSAHKADMTSYPLVPTTDFLFDASSLYHHHGVLELSQSPMLPMEATQRAPVTRLGKRGSLDSSVSDIGSMRIDEDVRGTAPATKRTRREPPPSGRVPGACTRCKRLKMKCTFADGDSTCARCIVGGHECIVLGRKPRSPGVREILRKQIREKDAMIDNLLAQLNPMAPSTTPLSLNVSKLALSPEQKTAYRDVLAYFEKSQSVKGPEKKIDVSTLDEDSEYESDSDCGDAEGDGDDASNALCHPHVPTKCAPAGLLAKTALETRCRSRRSSPSASIPGRSESDHGSDDAAAVEAGIGNLSYFEPGPSSNLDLRRLIIERQAAPDILLSGLVTNDDVGKLFCIFWKRINPIVPLLDENIHTPASVLGRCPFLFTVICALSARFYDEKPEMYTLAIHLAKTSAANSFLDGWKTIEMCQAYALLASYMPPARRWDEDRTRFYSGIAIRLAIDLDLYRVPEAMPSDERGEREVLNRLRTFIVCYIQDRGACINLGKPFTVPEVELIRNVNTLFNSSKYRLKSDSYLVSMVELYRIMTRFASLANPAVEPKSACHNETDLIATHKVFSEELVAWESAAVARCAEDEASQETDDRLRMGLMHLTYQYCRLVTFSSGLQQIVSLDKIKEDKIFFTGCLQAASAVIKVIIDRILPTGFVRYSTEHIFALSAFGTAVLMKCLKQCLRPEFSSKLAGPQEERIFQLIKQLIKALDKDDIEHDDQTSPRRCYAKFLQQLLTVRLNNMSRENATQFVSTGPLAPVVQVAQHTMADGPQFIPAVNDGKTMDFVHTHNPADLVFAQPWDAMHPQQEAPATNTILGFSETEYMQAFMAFPDQPWFMQ